MEFPSILRGESLTSLARRSRRSGRNDDRGFNWGGWALGSTADKIAKERADSAAVVALAPICVDKFRQAANATENLSELNKINYAWDRLVRRKRRVGDNAGSGFTGFGSGSGFRRDD